jgi:hypothetical protein
MKINLYINVLRVLEVLWVLNVLGDKGTKKNASMQMFGSFHNNLMRIGA